MTPDELRSRAAARRERFGAITNTPHGAINSPYMEAETDLDAALTGWEGAEQERLRGFVVSGNLKAERDAALQEVESLGVKLAAAYHVLDERTEEVTELKGLADVLVNRHDRERERVAKLVEAGGFLAATVQAPSASRVNMQHALDRWHAVLAEAGLS